MDEICEALSSSKVTLRKKGRGLAEQLLKDDRYFVVATYKQWTGIVDATIRFELSEVQDDLRKDKKTTNANGNAGFVKNIISYTVLHASPISEGRTKTIIGHILTVLYDRNIDNKYKEEHQSLLSELLRTHRFHHAIDIQTLLNVFNYLKTILTEDILLEQRGRTRGTTGGGTSNSLTSALKLLKSFCQALFSDITYNVISLIYKWFSSMLTETNGIIAAQGLLTLTIVDCYCILFDNFYIATLDHLFPQLEQLLRVILQQISQCKVVVKDVYARFLFKLSSFLLHSFEHLHYPSRGCLLQLLPVFKSIIQCVISDDYLRYAVLHAHNHAGTRGAQSRDGYLRSIDEPRVRLNFEACASLCRLDEMLECSYHCHTMQSEPTLILDDVFHRLISLGSLRGSGVGLGSGSTSTSTFGTQSTQHTVVAQSASTSTALPQSGSGSASGGGTVSHARNPNRQASATLMEGLLLLVATVASQDPSGVSLTRNGRLCRWLNILKGLLVNAAEVASESQTHGNILNCLLSLSRMDSHNFLKDTRHIQIIKMEWTNIIEILLSKDVFLKYLSRGRKSSVSELVFGIIENVLKHSLLLNSALLSYQQAIWRLSIFVDPFNVESCAVFSLMAHLLNTTENGVPEFVFLREDSLGLTDQSTWYPELLNVGVRGDSDHCIRYGVIWLMRQVDATACARWAMQAQMKELMKGFHLMLASAFKLPMDLPSFQFPNIPSGLNSADEEFFALRSAGSRKNWFDRLEDVASAIEPFDDVEGISYSDIIRDRVDAGHEAHISVDLYLRNRDIHSKTVLALLSYLFRHLISSVRSEAAVLDHDGISSWQLVSLLLSSTISSYLTIMSLNPTDLIENTKRDISQAVLMLFELIDAILAVLQARVKSIKVETLSEHLLLLVSIVQRGCSPSVSNLVVNYELGAIRLKVHKSFLDLATTLRNLCLGDGNVDTDEDGHNANQRSVAVTTGSTKKRPRSNVGSDDDDFMDDPSNGFGDSSSSSLALGRSHDKPASAVTSASAWSDVRKMIPRLVFSVHHMEVFVSTAQAALVILPTDDTACRVCNLLTLKKCDDNDVENKISVDPDVFLYVAMKLADVASVDSLQEYFLDIPWERHLGLIGYYAVLSILYKMLSRPEFINLNRKSSVYEDSMSKYVEMIFPTGLKIGGYGDLYWRIRYIRILAGAMIFREQPHLCKDQFAACIKEGIGDDDYRVRALAAKTLPLLFVVFTKHRPIYDTMQKAIRFPLIVPYSSVSGLSLEPENADDSNVETRAYDGLLCISAVSSLAHMAASSAAVLDIALLHILTICVSRIKCNSSCAATNTRTETTMTDLAVLVQSALKMLANCFEYTTVPDLVQDHISFLLKEWWSLGLESESKLVASSLHLVDFPFFILGHMNPREFYIDCGGYIVQQICQLQNPSYRWKLLKEYAEGLGYGSSDGGIATVLKCHICNVKASEVAWRALSSRVVSSTGAGESDDFHDVAEHISGFLRRVLTDEQETVAFLAKYPTDFVIEVCSYLLDCHAMTVGENAMDDINVIEDVLNCALTYVCEIIHKVDIGKLLASCNIIEILSMLRNRMILTRRADIQKILIVFLSYLIQNFPVRSTCLLSSFLSTIVTCAQHSPRHLYISCLAIQKLVNNVDKVLDDASATLLEDLRIKVSDLFAEVLCLLHVTRNVRDSTHIFSKYHHENQIAAHDVKYDKVCITVYIKHFQKELKNKKSYRISESDLNSSVQVLSNCLVTMYAWCSRPDGSVSVADCFPLPTEVFSALPQETQKLLEGNLWESSCEQRIDDLVDYIFDYLRGVPLSQPGLWWRIFRVRNALQTQDVTSSELWKSHGESVACCISYLLEMCNDRVILNLPVVEDIMLILGYLGTPDVYAVTHRELPSKACNHSGLQGQRLKCRIVLKIFSLLVSTSEPSVAASASYALRSSNASGVFTELMPKVKDSLTKQVFEIYRTDLIVRSTEHHSASTTGSDIRNQIDDPDVWISANRDYETWICQLTSKLIRCCYRSLIPDLTPVFPSSDKRGDPMLGRGGDADIRGSDMFLAPLAGLCEKNTDIAEAVLPLLFDDILEKYGAQSTAATVLSRCVSQYMLQSEQASPQATRLACQVLVFLLRQDIARFMAKAALKRTNRTGEEDRASRGSANDMVPYSYILNIDLGQAAAAAVHCGCIATALLFAEFAVHSSRSKAEVSFPLCKVESRSVIAPEILLKIYSGLHDPDAVYGAVCQSNNLQMQAQIYAHTGQHMAALATYESMMHTRVDSMHSLRPEEGIAQALRGLGSQHVLNLYARQLGNNFPNAASIISESWRTPEVAHAADISLRRWSCSEHLPSVCTHDLSNTIPGNSNVQGSGKIEMSVIDFLAIRNKNQLQVNFSCPLFMDVGYGDDQSDQYYNDILSCSLRHFSRNDTQSTKRCIRGCTYAVLPKIVELSTHESAVDLAKELAKLQQLVEIVEVSDLGTAGNSVKSTQKLLHRWRGRLDTSSPTTGGGLLSLRLRLIQELLKSKRASPGDAVGFMYQILDFIRGRSSIAHAVSPIVYQLETVINEHGSEKDGALLVPDVARGVGRGSSTLNKFITRMQWLLHDANFLWAKGLTDVARFSLHSGVVSQLTSIMQEDDVNSTAGVLSQKQKSICCDILSESLRTLGSWLIDKKGAHVPDIMNNFLSPSITAADSIEQKIKANLSQGNCNAALYHSIKWRLSSQEWQLRLKVMSERREELEQCRALYRDMMTRKQAGEVLDEELKVVVRHVTGLQKEVELDAHAKAGSESCMAVYLTDALTHFSRVLEISPDNDQETVFLVLNLWLENAQVLEVNKIMTKLVDKTPSFKFLPLTYQIFSRLGGQESSTLGDNMSFQTVLKRLITKLCFDHPYHTLPQLFALSFEERVGEYSGASQFRNNVSLERIRLANELLAKLGASERLAGLVTAMRTLLIAYMDLAMANTKKFTDCGRTKDLKFRELSTKSSRDLGFHECLRDCPVASMPAVLTAAIPIRSDACYKDVIQIVKFLPIFSITDTGISRPKIIECQGTDGVTYKQLVKGGDDMRQDAVLQQVFEITNTMLQRNVESRHRLLRLRTYKIVPMSPQTGVLEWVNDTIPFGSFLLDKDKNIGAHGRYHPTDWTNQMCREKLRDLKAPEERLKAFKEICANIRPVFRYFFLEYSSDPASWLTNRLAYTRSVAVNSMVGYVLGIGDRHAQNILVDTRSAEVIHIDFGIVFEQGKVLSTPETVPFRLTRDIVDGFGILGLDGTFQRCCEETLRVLKESSAQVKTVLEVVIHDPLYKWSLSPLQARMRQTTELVEVAPQPAAAVAVVATSTLSRRNTREKGEKASVATVNMPQKGVLSTQHITIGMQQQAQNRTSKDAAERALMRIKDKLHGYDDPTGDSLSVEGQVKMLIREAQSDTNLSQLFVGWAPWL